MKQRRRKREPEEQTEEVTVVRWKTESSFPQPRLSELRRLPILYMYW